MISTTELRLSIQNFTLKLWLKTAKILAKMPSNTDPLNFLQLLKGILYGAFLTHCASPRGHLRAKSKKNRKVEPLEDYTDTPQDPSRLCPEADMWLCREDGM